MSKIKVIAAIIAVILTALVILGIEHMQNADVRKCIRLASNIPELNMSKEDIKDGCEALKKSGKIEQFNSLTELINEQN